MKNSCGHLSRERMSYHIRFGIPSPVNKLNTEIKHFTSVLICKILVRKKEKNKLFPLWLLCHASAASCFVP